MLEWGWNGICDEVIADWGDPDIATCLEHVSRQIKCPEGTRGGKCGLAGSDGGCGGRAGDRGRAGGGTNGGDGADHGGSGGGSEGGNGYSAFGKNCRTR